MRPQDPALRSLGYETEVDGKRESGCPAQEHRGGSARAEASRGARQRNPLRRINDTLAKGHELVKRAKGSNTRLASIITIALLPSLTLAQPLPQPKPTAPGGSCPHGYTSSGSFCVPSQGAQDAIPLPPNGTCPHGWTRSGSFCLRSGSWR